MTPSDDETRIPCPRCRGCGRRTEVLTDGPAIHRTVTEREGCWLCDSLGSCNVTTLRAWSVSGKPIAKPEGWGEPKPVSPKV